MRTRKRWSSLLIASTLLLCLMFGSSAAQAGPPLICHPVEIGDAQSLPWGSDPFARSTSYNIERLIDDTVKILDNQSSVIVHMETLRRAALYVGRDSALATRILARLMARALDAEAVGTPNALSWFDAGYLAQCYEQLGMELGLACGEAQGVTGYAWVRRALALRGDDPELEFGAAMLTALAGIPEHEMHVTRVKELAKKKSLVARNLRIHSTKYWSHHRRKHRG